jgi:uncharacterized repeat protein (TIGR02543 family)
MKMKKLLTTFIVIAVVLFVGCKNDDYVAINGGPCPVVILVTPVNGATLVGKQKVSAIENAIRTTIVTATFNKKMDPKTINESTFTVNSTSPVAGTVTYTDSTATFTASSKFADNTTFTARVTTGVKDVMGNAMQSDYVWTFSTGTTILPVVIATDPLNLATGVALNKIVNATFSMPMDGSTLTSAFTLMNGTTAVSGTVATTGAISSFTPTVALNPGTLYTAKITMAAKNLDGSAIASDYTWTFTTINVYALNITAVNGTVVKNPNALTYTSGTNVVLTATANAGYTFSSWSGDATGTTNPLTVNVNSAKNITANFTSNASNFTLNVTSVNGTVSKNPNQLTYPNGTNVVLTATGNAGYTFASWSGDVTGTVSPLTVNMNANKNITANFTAPAGTGPGNINLGGAAIYTILSKTGISTLGVTSITGNIGVSPAAATAITGFGLVMDPSNVFAKSNPSTLVSGNVYAADYAVPTPANISTAVTDMQTAFTTANGLTTTVITELGAGNITGMTLAPGLYKWSTGLLISASGVTLTGSANDTWVFQIGQGMTVANGAIIHLAGGAQAKNIYWITASDAVLGTTVNFSGNILSQTLISINTGSTVTGRLLGQTAVTLNAATVIFPQ